MKPENKVRFAGWVCLITALSFLYTFLVSFYQETDLYQGFSSTFLAIFFIQYLVIGIFLFKLENWARVYAIILSFIPIIEFPLMIFFLPAFLPILFLPLLNFILVGSDVKVFFQEKKNFITKLDKVNFIIFAIISPLIVLALFLLSALDTCTALYTRIPAWCAHFYKLFG